MGEPNDPNNALFHRECNWLQALEGDIETSHLAFLHAGCVDVEAHGPERHAYLPG